MIAYYINCGHKLEDLLNMTYVERVFMHYAREEHYKEERIKWNSLLNGNGGE